MDDIAREKGWDPKAFRLANLMPLGYVDPFNGITCHSTGLAECIEKGADFIGWAELREKYKEQSGPVRRGVGMACFSYKTGVYPISLETASARMVLNQDGTVQLHLGPPRSARGATPCSPRWPPRPSAFPPRTYILSLPGHRHRPL